MRVFFRTVSFLAALMIIVYGMIGIESHAEPMWLVLLLIASILLAFAFIPSPGPRSRGVGRPIVVCAVVFIVGFIVMSVQLVRIQVVESAAVASKSEEVGDGSVLRNPRYRVQDANVARGRIFTRDGVVVADTVEREDGSFDRIYPEPSVGYLVGYHSPVLYGSSNLESAYNDVLIGNEGGNPFNEWMDEILHRTRHGYDLQLTIDLEMQREADRLLSDRRGAVVVMDAQTGAVLSMVSKPNFNPEPLHAGLGGNANQEIERATEYWEEISQTEGAPLVLRPTQGLYAPGSVFKTISAAAALETGIAEPDTVYRDQGQLAVGTDVIVEPNLPDDRIDYTLTESYSYSLNVVFAQLGLQLGPERIRSISEQFGFGESIPFDLNVSPSQVTVDPNFLSLDIGLAETAFGQGQLFATPLQIAMMSQAIVNDGESLEPYLVQSIKDEAGRTLRQQNPTVWKRAISEETAREMQAMMIESVDIGYASDAEIPGLTVGGKTGTAEVGDGEPHAWFTGFAGADEPRYVVSVIVENGGSGSEQALPIGRSLLEMAVELAPELEQE